MTHLPKQDRLGWHHEAPFPPSLSPSLPQAHRFTPLATSPLREGVFGVWVIVAGVLGLRWVRGLPLKGGRGAVHQDPRTVAQPQPRETSCQDFLFPK